jgi:hypothetical protein
MLFRGLVVFRFPAGWRNLDCRAFGSEACESARVRGREQMELRTEDQGSFEEPHPKVRVRGVRAVSRASTEQ